MIVFHGTTDRAARQIVQEGFLPRKPSKRVWFAAGRGYAHGRARAKARRAHARPVVLTCEINLGELRAKYGSKRVRIRNGIIAIDAPVPAGVLRSAGEPFGTPSTPAELAEWLNRVLGLKPHKGVGARHPGVVRLARWVANRIQDRPRRGIKRTELLAVARQWLPEFFEGVRIDPEDLHVYRQVDLGPEPQPEPEPPADPREAEALELLDSGAPKRRARGLEILAELGDCDLFEWCAMYLDDDSPAVRLAALHAMARCEDIDADLVEPLARSPDNRLRGAAIAVLAARGGAKAPSWFERGLKDPSPCVRLETAKVLAGLDPERHRAVFQLALYDPNPKVAEIAEKLVAHKGYPKVTWGLGPSHYPEGARTSQPAQ